jgi:hypothetical protein
MIEPEFMFHNAYKTAKWPVTSRKNSRFYVPAYNLPESFIFRLFEDCEGAGCHFQVMVLGKTLFIPC